MYTDFDTLREFHLEITNRCNASCPMCARNVLGSQVIDGLVPSELRVEQVEKIFDARFVRLEHVLLCGTHGDPIMAQSTLPAIDVIQNKTQATIEVFTNGGVRDETWWKSLGERLRRSFQRRDGIRTDICAFGIDGLAGTHELYRRGTQFDRVIHNMDVFIRSGGIARWDYLVFKHNEHQVEEAKELAKKMGVQHFRLRKSSRFAASSLGPEQFPVLSRSFRGTRAQADRGLREGRLTADYLLEPPTRLELTNNTIQKMVIQQKSTERLSRMPISCLYQKRFSRLFVNSTAQVFPCCFLHDESYKSKSDYQTKIVERFGSEFNSLDHHSWEEILRHPWFQSELESSWGQTLSSGQHPRLERCARTCGSELNPILSQTQNVPLGDPSVSV